MTLELSFLSVLLVLVATIAVLVLGLAKVKKRGLKLTFSVLLVLFSVVNISWLLGQDSRSLSTASSAASILVFPLATLIVLFFLYPTSSGKQAGSSLVLIIPALGLVAWTIMNDIGPDRIYGSPLVYLFITSCIAIGVVEASWGWFKSRIVKNQCYLFVLALFVLLTTGPLYEYELRILGYEGLKGASLGAPIVGALLLAPLVWANPIIVRESPIARMTKSKTIYRLAPGKSYAISEKRPKYCYTFLKDLASVGYPTLLVTHSESEETKSRADLDNIQIVGLSAKDTSRSLRVNNLGRILTTLVEFMETRRKAVVLIDNLNYLLSNNDLQGITELVQRLMRSAERKRGWLLLSFTLLTKDEESALMSLGLQRLRMPLPEKVMTKILLAHTGDMSDHFLKIISKTLNMRIRDLTVEDIPDVSRVVVNTMRALGAATRDAAIMKNWETQAMAIQSSFYYLYRAPLSFLVSEQWKTWDPMLREEQPREEESERMEVIEKATTGGAIVERRPDKISLLDEVKGVLTNHLGDFGNNLFQMECDSLGMEPSNLSSEDVQRLAEKVGSTITRLGDFIDIPNAGEEMRLKAENLKEELKAISKEELE